MRVNDIHHGLLRIGRNSSFPCSVHGSSSPRKTHLAPGIDCSIPKKRCRIFCFLQIPAKQRQTNKTQQKTRRTFLSFSVSPFSVSQFHLRVFFVRPFFVSFSSRFFPSAREPPPGGASAGGEWWIPNTTNGRSAASSHPFWEAGLKASNKGETPRDPVEAIGIQCSLLRSDWILHQRVCITFSVSLSIWIHLWAGGPSGISTSGQPNCASHPSRRPWGQHQPQIPKSMLF